MRTIWKFVLLQLFFTAKCRAVIDLDLGGDWLVKDTSGEYSNIDAKVPGGIYSDLMNSNIIGDIFYGYNDTETKWVPRRNWTYYTNFTVSADILDYESVNIVFEGLDTFAQIVINDEVVGSSRNMFVRYIFDVKDVLKAGENKIEVRFTSSIEVAAQLAEEQAKQYVVPPTCPPDEYRGECNVNMIRKMQASYSWDWGPSFPSMGIWKDIYIEAYNETKIRYIAPKVSDNATHWHVDIDVYLANNARGQVAGNLYLGLKGERYELAAKNVTVLATPLRNQYGEIIHSTRFTLPKNSAVLTWMPNGYGQPNLYNLNAHFTSNSEEKHNKTVRVGLRTIELVQETEGNGLSFYFKVNGVPIYIKGSNQIPLNILPERGQNPELIEKLLTTVYYSNMNMLRVWGGGVYESDYFYQLADEYGILIWQDFMFACAMYPTYDSYLENVIEEVRHQVNRLRHHPSIALFAGNNENEAALRDSWYGTASNFELYYNDYVKLYIDTIKTEFERITQNSSIFLSSSPSNGLETIDEGYVAQNPSDFSYGDVHFYNYVSDPWDSNIYPISRFTSEYGYQSLPRYESLYQAYSNLSAVLDINSDFMDHRQHHPDGNDQMKELIEFNLRLPEETHRNYTEAFIYYLQIAQAVGIKIETEHYRRYRGILNNGLGNNMGALYWQLNDVWVAPTWSGIDFTGRWKMLQYFVKDFFDDIIITGHINSERTLEVYTVNDVEDIENVIATITVFNWNSFNPVKVEELNITVEGARSNLIKSLDTDVYLAQQNCGSLNDAKTSCFFYLTLTYRGYPVAPPNYVFPAPLKDCELVTPNIRITEIVHKESNIFDVQIDSDNIALFVWLDTITVEGTFSENGFLMVNSTKTILFASENTITVEQLQNSITITNLLDQRYFN